MTMPTSCRTGRFILTMLAAGMLAGCAGQQLQNEGLRLLEEGREDEGLAKLEEASRADPQNFAYRIAYTRSRDKVVARLVARGNAERGAEHFDAAKTLYQRALRFDPGSIGARTGLDMLTMDQRHAPMLAEATALIAKKDLEGAAAIVKRVLVEDPVNARAASLQRQIDDQAARSSMPAPGLRGKFKKPVTLQFRDANLKMVFEALARTSGINVLLDKDVKGDTKISIFVKDVSVEDAVDLIMLQSQLEKKVISDNTVFIYPNSPAKLKEHQDLKIRSFHLVNADPKQMLTMIKTLLKTKDLFIHEKTNSIVMRDTPEAIQLAEMLILDQDLPDPEVMLEVEVLEISGSRLSEIGIDYPTQISFAVQAPAQGSGLTLSALRQANPDTISVSPAPRIALNLMLQDGDTNLLASPRIRARNHEKAKIMIGDRVPVITNAVTPISTGTPVITGSVQYLDVGLKLEVEPDIHLDNEVGIKISLEVSSIVKEVQNAVSGTLAYQVGTRNASTVLRLKDGETQILAGLINDEDRNSASKVPGLGQLPILGRLFSSNRGENRKTEIVLSITPRIVSNNRIADARKTEYWAGTESSLRTNPLMLRPLGTVAVSAPGPSKAAATLAAARGAATAAVPVPAPAPLAPPGNAPGLSDAAMPPPSPAGIATPATQPLLLSWQGPNQAKVGDTISVTVNAQSSQRVGSLGFSLDFDPAVLKAVDVVEGSFLKQGGAASLFTKDIDDAGGHITLGLSSGGNAGTSGAGSLATFVFQVIAPRPQAQITVSQFRSAGAGGDAVAFTALEPHSVEATP